MYRLLLPVDDDRDRARGQAAFVTDMPLDNDAITAVLTHTLTADEADAPEDLKRVERVDTVQAAQAVLEDAGVDVEFAEARHPPAEGILELAGDLDADHIVMGSRKRSPTGKAVFGSVSQTVVLEADVPVTIAGAREE